MRVGPSQRRDQQNERKGLPERPMVRKASKALAVPRQLTALKNRSRQNNRKAGEGCDRNESPDPHAVHDEKLRLTKLEQQELVSKCDHLSVPQLGSGSSRAGKVDLRGESRVSRSDGTRPATRFVDHAQVLFVRRI